MSQFLKSAFSILLVFFSLWINAQVNFVSSNLPVIIINTNGIEIPDDPKIVAQMTVLNTKTEGRNFVNDKNPEYEGRISIELRGSTSMSFPKKQYSLETQKEDGKNNNVSLLGMPAENDWILNGPYGDKSCIRNTLAYNLGEKLGHYAPRSKFCELLLDGSYQGIYLLTEKIKIDDNRVNISEMQFSEVKNTDYPGGFIIAADRGAGEGERELWSTNSSTLYALADPKSNQLSDNQVNYIFDKILDMEHALFFEECSEQYCPFLQKVDLSSFVDFFIIQELSKNIDAYNLSTFFYCEGFEKDNKIKIGPLWDFNLAFGNNYTNDSYVPQEFIAETRKFWEKLYSTPTFKNFLINRWADLRQNALSNFNLNLLVDSLSGEIGEASVRNFEKWDILGRKIWPNYYVGETHAAEISYIKNWLRKRCAWMDRELLDLSMFKTSSQEVNVLIFPNHFTEYLNIGIETSEAASLRIAVRNYMGIKTGYLINGEQIESGYLEFNLYGENLKLIPKGLNYLEIIIDDKVVEHQPIIRN